MISVFPADHRPGQVASVFILTELESLVFDDPRPGRLKRFDKNDFALLIEAIESDIMNAVNLNYAAGNISYADMLKLCDTAGQLYDQITLHYRKKGGGYTMRPLLPSALRLPNDKYIFKLEKLEDKYAEAQKTNATLSDENERLKARIRELEMAASR